MSLLLNRILSLQLCGSMYHPIHLTKYAQRDGEKKLGVTGQIFLQKSGLPVGGFITHAYSSMSPGLPSDFLFFFGVTFVHANLCVHILSFGLSRCRKSISNSQQHH